MSKLVRFKGYGVNSPDPYVNLGHVISFHEISYNGNHGTEILLTNGTAVHVSEFPEDVKKALESD